MLASMVRQQVTVEASREVKNTLSSPGKQKREAEPVVSQSPSQAHLKVPQGTSACPYLPAVTLVTEPFGGPAGLQQQQPPSILAHGFILLYHFLNVIRHTREPQEALTVFSASYMTVSLPWKSSLLSSIELDLLLDFLATII